MDTEAYVELPKDANGVPVYPGDTIYLIWNDQLHQVLSINYFMDSVVIMCDENGGFVIDDDFKRDPLAKFYVVDGKIGGTGYERDYTRSPSRNYHFDVSFDSGKQR